MTASFEYRVQFLLGETIFTHLLLATNNNDDINNNNKCPVFGNNNNKCPVMIWMLECLMCPISGLITFCHSSQVGI